MLKPRPAALLFALVFLVGLLAALNLAAALGQPFGGFFAGYSHAANLWTLEASTPPWWPVIANDILRYDDALITVDNQPYNFSASAAYLAAQTAGRDSVMIVVRRDNFPIEVHLPLRIFTLGNYFDIKLPDLINGFGFWLLAVAVFRARAHDPVNRVFALATALAGGAIWLTIPGLYIEAPGLTRGLQLVWVPIASFVGALFIHLTLLFPAPVRHPVARWLSALYTAMTIVVVLYIVSFIMRWTNGPTPLANSLGTLGNWAVIG
ncbi:MAG TPA: hypothetical protein VI547_12530, partial [Anaerolineales bacterium]|nr:hypothetical protein [Anaerolineales bacterium]